MNYDYIIIGAGLFGAITARELSNNGKKVLVLEKRNHIGGNCYTQRYGNINIHQYGPHIFHTNNKHIFNYINQFAEFNHYKHHIKVNHENNIYSFPINMLTFHQIWGVTTPEQAKQKINEVCLKIDNPQNLEEYALYQVGQEIYDLLIYG